MEYQRFPEGIPPVSTFEFHEHRERAPHLEQGVHRARLMRAAEYAVTATGGELPKTIVDLGCGDGGLVSILSKVDGLIVRGFDFQPSNAEGWLERGVLLNCRRLNFIDDWDEVPQADVYIITEVLEHLNDPHEMVRRIYRRGARIVCSSPWMEHEGNIDGCHAWAWDMPGYVKMLNDAGFTVMESAREGIFQVHWAVPA